MLNIIKRPYHLVEVSPWLLFISGSAIGLTTGTVEWFHNKSIGLSIIRLLIILIVIHQWWRDTSREGSYQGLYVLIRTLFLFFTFIRLNLVEININHHFEFEAAARYLYLIDEIFEALEKLLVRGWTIFPGFAYKTSLPPPNFSAKTEKLSLLIWEKSRYLLKNYTHSQ